MDTLARVRQILSKTQDNEGWIRQGKFRPVKNLLSMTQVDDDLLGKVKNVLSGGANGVRNEVNQWKSRPKNQIFNKYIATPYKEAVNTFGQYQKQNLLPYTGTNLITKYQDKINQFRPGNIGVGKALTTLFADTPQITEIKNKVGGGGILNPDEKNRWNQYATANMADFNSVTANLTNLGSVSNLKLPLSKLSPDDKLKPISERVKQVHKLIFGDNRIPTSKRGFGSDSLNRLDDDPLLASQRIVDMMNRKTAGQKANIWDYIGTPEKVLKRIGLEDESILLRRGYENYRKSLKVEIDRVSQWASRLPDDVSNKRVFDWLDGKKVTLASDEMAVAVEIKDYLSKWADKLDIPPEGRISDYITHIFEKGDIELEFNPDIAKMIENKVPGSVYNPFLQERGNAPDYIRDTWRALDAYVKRATRKVNLDPALDRIQMAADSLDTASYDYIKKYISNVNMRPQKVDELLDNWIKTTPVGYKFTSRPVAYLSRKIRQTIYRATLGLNPGSALRNLSQGANTYAELGEKYTLKGYYELTKKMLTNNLDELYKVGVLEDQFIQDRSLHAVKSTIEKIDPYLFGMFEWAEKVNRGSAYFGAKARALTQGLDEDMAIEAAKAVVRKTQFAFGSIDTPVALQGDIVKIFTQFQGYSLKQAEFLTELVKTKNFAGIARYTGSMMLFIGTVGQAFGMDIKEIIPSIRLKSPTQQLWENAKGIVKEDDQTSPQKGLSGIAALTIPGGTQLKKTLEGLGAVNRGYSRTPSGNVRFPVEQSTSNLLRGGLFGQWNLPEGQEYFKSDVKPLGEKQTQEFIDSPDRETYYQKLLKNRQIKQDIEGDGYITSKDSPKSGLDKAIVYGKSIVKDPLQTIKAVLKGNPIRKVEGGVVILERKQGLGQMDKGNKATEVDHIIALTLGGTNDELNLQILTKDENRIKGQVETYLFKELKAGRISKAEAQARNLNWKNEVDNLPKKEQKELVESLVEESESVSTGQNKYIISNEETGNESEIDLTFPKLAKTTGYAEVDKANKTSYSSALTKIKSNARKLYEDGQLSIEEYNQILEGVAKARNKSSGSGGSSGSRRKVSFVKIRPKSVKTITIKGHKPKMIKISNPKIKVSDFKVKDIWQ